MPSSIAGTVPQSSTFRATGWRHMARAFHWGRACVHTHTHTHTQLSGPHAPCFRFTLPWLACACPSSARMCLCPPMAGMGLRCAGSHALSVSVHCVSVCVYGLLTTHWLSLPWLSIVNVPHTPDWLVVGAESRSEMVACAMQQSTRAAMLWCSTHAQLWRGQSEHSAQSSVGATWGFSLAMHNIVFCYTASSCTLLHPAPCFILHPARYTLHPAWNLTSGPCTAMLRSTNLAQLANER